MNHLEKERLVSAIADAIQSGATKYITDEFEYTLPSPQRAGTMTQQRAYAYHAARQLLDIDTEAMYQSSIKAVKDRSYQIKASIEELFGGKVNRLKCLDDDGYEWEFLDEEANKWQFSITMQDED